MWAVAMGGQCLYRFTTTGICPRPDALCARPRPTILPEHFDEDTAIALDTRQLRDLVKVCTAFYSCSFSYYAIVAARLAATPRRTSQ
jgi:hypothetical protein